MAASSRAQRQSQTQLQGPGCVWSHARGTLESPRAEGHWGQPAPQGPTFPRLIPESSVDDKWQSPPFTLFSMQLCGARRNLSKGYHADKHGDLPAFVRQTQGAWKVGKVSPGLGFI